MIPLRQRLATADPLLADGAMGTMLLERGLRPGDSPERICLENPGLLEEIAGLYISAGAEMVQTNTFGASPLQLARHGLDGMTREINAAALAAARRAASGRAYIAASMGPSGRLLEPYGDTPEDALFASFRRQADVLVGEGADAVCVETMIDAAEAVLAVRAVRSVSASIPIIATMTFEVTPRGFHTIMGTDIPGAAALVRDAGADVVGANCGNGSAVMASIAAEFRACTSLPIAIRANAGLPAMTAGRPVYPESPEFMAALYRSLLDLGVTILGGCCGTTPAHTAALRAMLNARRDTPSGAPGTQS